jgi:hypothetical protein
MHGAWNCFLKDSSIPTPWMCGAGCVVLCGAHSESKYIATELQKGVIWKGAVSSLIQ